MMMMMMMMMDFAWVYGGMQMGSQYKSKALEEQVAKILKKWHAEVRERRKNQYSLRSPRATDQSITRESPNPVAKTSNIT
uniref:TFIIS N-terminal domain-containing protein n=1 Tax=Salix viminalis TaxID=40686 RepID=A0A6N2LA87_SALVM